MIKKGVDVFNRLAHTQNGHNSQSCCTERKPGTRIFFWVSHVSSGAQALGPFSFVFFSCFSKELDQKWND